MKYTQWRRFKSTRRMAVSSFITSNSLSKSTSNFAIGKTLNLLLAFLFFIAHNLSELHA